MQRRYIAVTMLVPLVIIGLFLLRGHIGSERPPAQMRVSVNSWVGFGPLYVAQREGLFAKNGTSVEIIKIEGGPDRRAALIAGRVDLLGASLDDFAVTVDEGIDALAVSCADFSNGADGILVGKGIVSLQDLAKSQVALQPGLPNHFFLLYVLDQAGIDSRQLKILPMQPDDAGAAFIAGHINAAVTWEPHLSRALKERSDARVLVRSDRYPEAILDLFVAKRDWISQHPRELENFRRSWDQAVDFIRAQPAAADKILATELALKPGEVQGMLGGVALLTNSRCQSMLEPKIDKLGPTVERLWKQAGFIKKTTNLAGRLRLR